VSGATVALAALVPVLLLALSSFVKLSVVLSLLRNALGAPEAPSSLVVTSLSLVLTIFVMAPVANQMVTAMDAAPSTTGAATVPLTPSQELLPDGLARNLSTVERGLGPLRTFLTKHSGARELATFTGLAHEMGSPAARGDELWVLAPAFVVTELKEAFAIAVVLFIPFLVLDLVVGLTLGALGLTTTSTQTVALPLKLVLFVAVDGWRLLVEGLLRGYL